MIIHNKTSRESIQSYASLIKRREFKHAFDGMSYLTGMGAVFYTAAIMDELNELEKAAFKDALTLACDRVAKV